MGLFYVYYHSHLETFFDLNVCVIVGMNFEKYGRGNVFSPVFIICNFKLLPIPVAARSKVWVYGRSLTGIVGSNPA
jgi:hypothetical protein